MLFTSFKVGENEYKLRLSASGAVRVEQKLGQNPLNILMSVENNQIPALNDILIILWGSMTSYKHDIKLEDVYRIYDEYVDEGNVFTDLIPVILDVFKVSGYIKSETKEENEKNV